LGCGEPNDRVTGLATADPSEIAVEPGEPVATDLEICGPEGGELISREWSLDKQTYGDIRAGLIGCYMVVEIVGSVSSREVEGELSKFGKWVVRIGCKDVL
jgi:hypothetical protein